MNAFHVAVSLLVAVALLTGSAQSSDRLSGGVALTREGVALRNFEGLLRKSFPKAAVVSASETPTGALDFSCSGFCAPSARYSSYRFVFARHTTSKYRLVSRSFRGTWGNYRRPMLIRGRSIACDASATRFLIQQRQAVSFTVECVRPPA